MLRAAINEAKAAAPRAVDDLVRCASFAATAVRAVTGGAAALELQPVERPDNKSPVYQLVLRRVGSDAPPSDLGMYGLSDAGYPVLWWYTRAGWEAKPDSPNEQFTNYTALEGNFKWRLSKPESSLVVLITFFQQQAQSGTPNAS
jgi:hypothetical protein